jgi:hypothetical protein
MPLLLYHYEEEGVLKIKVKSKRLYRHASKTLNIAKFK